MRPRSIRVRLMLWYLAILAAVLVAFSGAVYLRMRSFLIESLDDSIANRSTLVEKLVKFDSGGQPSLDLSGGADDLDVGEVFARLYSTSGELLFDNSGAPGESAIDGSHLERALAGEQSTGASRSREGQARVLTSPLVRNGDVIGILQTGASTADTRETLRTLRVILALGTPAALALASVGGWWLASRALTPIDRITRTAAEINETDLSRRLGLDLPDDEVGRLARTFDAMIARLDGSFQRQRQFTADASHELRTPLTAIRGEVDVTLERPREATEYRRVLTAVNEQVDRMTRLVSGLLMLARSDAGALPLHRSPVDVGELVEDVVQIVRPRAEEKGLSLDVEAGRAATFEVDRDLMVQLLLNLADNAVAYTMRGTVSIGWRAVPRAAELFVRDTGPGIPPEHRDRIFERFHRVDTARARDAGGTGLGLAICKSIVEAHDGTIRVEDTPDGGATFVVRLPAAASAAEDAGAHSFGSNR